MFISWYKKCSGTKTADACRNVFAFLSRWLCTVSNHFLYAFTKLMLTFGLFYPIAHWNSEKLPSGMSAENVTMLILPSNNILLDNSTLSWMRKHQHPVYTDKKCSFRAVQQPRTSLVNYAILTKTILGHDFTPPPPLQTKKQGQSNLLISPKICQNCLIWYFLSEFRPLQTAF